MGGELATGAAGAAPGSPEGALRRAYCAPELLLEQNWASYGGAPEPAAVAAMDLWPVGLMTTEMLTGCVWAPSAQPAAEKDAPPLRWIERHRGAWRELWPGCESSPAWANLQALRLPEAAGSSYNPFDSPLRAVPLAATAVAQAMLAVEPLKRGTAAGHLQATWLREEAAAPRRRITGKRPELAEFVAASRRRPAAVPPRPRPRTRPPGQTAADSAGGQPRRHRRIRATASKAPLAEAPPPPPPPPPPSGDVRAAHRPTSRHYWAKVRQQASPWEQDDAEDVRCRCAGKCGNTAAFMNSLGFERTHRTDMETKRSNCLFRRAPGETWCQWCVCAHPGCRNVRKGCRAGEAFAEGFYCSGHRLPHLPLQALRAWAAPLAQRDPVDLEEFLQGCTMLAPPGLGSGAPEPVAAAGQAVLLFLLANVWEPFAMRALCRHFCAFPAKWTGQDLVKAWRRVVGQSAGQLAAGDPEYMLHLKALACGGACKHFGLLATSKRIKIVSGATPARAHDKNQLTLGSGGQRLVLSCSAAASVCSDLATASQRTDLAAAVEAVRNNAPARVVFQAVLREFHNIGAETLTQMAWHPSGYTAQALARKVTLLLLHAAGGGAAAVTERRPP